MTTYCEAIYEAFDYLLSNHEDVFVIGQGLWSPWYVGKTMDNLDKKYSKNRIIDTPVSESACTGLAVGASISGMRPIVVHPRMDFMLYCMDSIINEAAKWSYMFGGQSNSQLTIRSIINRGNEQGAQHSQSLQSLFCHIPGLQVVMPATVSDARDLFIAAVLSNNPTLYIDDRWLYEKSENIPPIIPENIELIQPKILQEGRDLTIVGCGYGTEVALNASKNFINEDFSIEIIDLRVLKPLKLESIIGSVQKTGRLIVVDIAWKNCGMAGEIIASVVENLSPTYFNSAPIRINLPDCPAPTSSILEKEYYSQENELINAIKNIFKS